MTGGAGVKQPGGEEQAAAPTLQRPSADTWTADEWRQRLEGIVGIPLTEGNEIAVLRNGAEIFPAMLSAIEDSERTIDFLTYVYWTGDVAQRFAHTLARKAQEGVRVRILLDAVGTATMDPRLVWMMSDAGCLVERFRMPTWRLWEADHRTHRKVLVCDEQTAFTGGVGIASEWEGDAANPDEWRDTHFRVRGPAVDGLRASFLSHWFETDHETIDEHDTWPRQPQDGGALVQVVRTAAQYGSTDMALLFRSLMKLAKTRLAITTAYFVPDDRVVGQLLDAADRGVDVHLLVPGQHHDKRVVQAAGEDRFDELLDGGVRISRYERTMLHAKILVVDRLVSFVGSANLDYRSMRLNAENNLVVIDAEVAGILEDHFSEDLEHSHSVEPGRWRRRGPVRRLMEKASGTIDDRL